MSPCFQAFSTFFTSPPYVFLHLPPFYHPLLFHLSPSYHPYILLPFHFTFSEIFTSFHPYIPPLPLHLTLSHLPSYHPYIPSLPFHLTVFPSFSLPSIHFTCPPYFFPIFLLTIHIFFLYLSTLLLWFILIIHLFVFLVSPSFSSQIFTSTPLSSLVYFSSAL